MRYVKMLNPDGTSPFQKHPWPLPTQHKDGTWEPGAWVEADTMQPLVGCGNGLHAYTEEQAQPNMRHDRTFWRIEYAEPPRDWGDKVSGYRARLTEPYPVPAWLAAVQPAIDALKDIPWFKPDGNPDPTWQLFPTWAAAEDAAWDAAEAAARVAARDAAGVAAWDAARVAARAAARDAARDAAWDAAGAAARAAARDAARDAVWDTLPGYAAQTIAPYVLMVTVCADLPIDQKHRNHAEACMNVWRKGYGLLGDVGGVLYVYERIA